MPDINPNTPFEDLLNAAGVHMPIPPSVNPLATSTDIAPVATEDLYYNFQNKINDFQAKKMSPSSIIPVSPFQVDISGRYNYQRIGGDTEDLYAQGQTGWEKAFNGATKGLALAGTTFLQGTLGLVYGVGEAIGKGEFNALYNNDLSNALQSFNNATENALPNYYTAKERSADWWEPSNVLTANFLWDKLIKNLGFSIGAIYSGAAVSKVLQLVPSLFNLSKAGQLASIADRLESTLASTPSLQRLSSTVSEVTKASNAVNNISKLLSPTERLVVSTLGAATEGGIEALQGVNDWRNKQIQAYKDANGGVAPDLATMEKIDDASKNLGNARFLMNMGLLTVTNYIQLPKILSSSYKESKSIANGIERTLNPIVKDESTGLFRSALPTSTAGKLLYRTKNVASLFFSPSEAFEEGAQNAIQQGVEDYYNKAYKGEGKSWVDSISEGWRQTLHTNSGLEQILIGGLSGGLQQAGVVSSKGFGKTGEIGERGITGYGGEKAKHTTEFLSQLNNSKLSLKSDAWLKDTAASAARGINLQKEGEAYIRQGDVLESKDNEFDYQHNYVYPRIKYGRFDLIKDDINNYREISSTPGGLQTLQQNGIANANDTQQMFQQRLTNFEAHARNIDSLYQSLNIRYGGLVNKDTNTPLYTDETIDKMVYAASKIADYDTRVPLLNAQLALSGVPTQDVIDSIVKNNTPAIKATEEAIAYINSLDVLSEIKDQLKSDLRDVIELSLRRKNFIKEYDQLKTNPQKFQKAPPDILSRTVSINPDTELEIGKTYQLATPLLREGNTISINPTITINSKTLGGELEITTPTGDTTHLTPKDVDTKYSPSTASAALQEDLAINKIAEKAIDSALSKEKDVPTLHTLKEKISYVNSLNNKELVDKIESEIKDEAKEHLKNKEKIAKEAEELAKNEKLKKELEAQQKANENPNPGPPDVPGNIDLDELDKSNNYKKAPLSSFLSKESDYYDPTNPKPHQKRRLTFLSTLATLPQQQFAKMNVIPITKNNEAHYGLSGLNSWIVQDIKTSLTDPAQREKYLDEKGNLLSQHEPIVKLYTIKDGTNYYIVSPQGKKFGILGSGQSSAQQLINEGVFGVFHSQISGKYEFGKAEGQANYSGTYTEEEFKKIQSQFQAWKDKILQITGESPVYAIDAISRGVILRDATPKPITETSLATEEDILNREHLITIPTKDGQITINNQSYNFPLGYPLLTNGSNVDFLNNRQFTPKEVEDIFQLLRQRVALKASAEAKRIEQYLSSILYLRSPQGSELPLPYQIFHTATGRSYNYHFSTNLIVPFNTAAMDANKQQIINFLSGYFVKINNKILQNPSPQGFEEAIVNKDNSISFKTHPSYQYFLLSTKANPSPFLQTKARKSLDNTDPSIISRYTTLKGNEFEFQQSTPTIQKAAPTQQIGAPKMPSLFGSRASKQAKESTIPQNLKKESKVIVENPFKESIIKEPVYHSSPNDFEEFDEGKIATRFDSKKGFYFTSSKEYAQTYLNEKTGDIKRGAQIYEVYLDIKNPYRETATGPIKDKIAEVYDKAKEGGYDAIIITDKNKTHDELVVFNKGQINIKSKSSPEDLISEAERLGKEFDEKFGEGQNTPKMPSLFGSRAQKDALKEKLEQERKEAQNNKPKNDDGEFKMAEPISSYSSINLQKEIAFIQAKTPFSVRILSDLIKTPQGLYAWGSYKNMAIKLYEKAQEGTGYHEVFEGVWKVFTTQEQKDAIVHEFRNRAGLFTAFDGTKYSTLKNADATEFQIKEKLADELADRIQTGAFQKEKPGPILRFLQSIWDFIKSIFSGETGHIDSLFAKIEAGHYKSMAYNNSSPSENEQYSLADVTYTQQYETVRGVAIQVIQEMINPSKDNSISLTEFEESSKSIDEFYDDVYKRLEGIYTNTIYQSENKLTDDQQYAYRLYWENLSTDWERVKELTNEYIKTFSIVESIKESKDETSNRDYVDDRKYFMNDAKNTASRSIKLLFATLPETIATASGGIQSRRASATFMQQQVQYSKTFNSLLAQLTSLNSYEEKINKLNELSEKFPNFKRLYQRITTPSNTSADNSVLNDWKLKVRWFQVMSKQNPSSFIQFNQADGTSFTQTANQQSSKKILTQSWIDTMKDAAISQKSKTFTISNRGELIINTKKLNFNIRSPKDKVEFLNQLLIPFTEDMYNSLNQQNKTVLNNAISGLSSQLQRKALYILDNAKSLDSVKNLDDIAQSYILAGNDFESTFFNIERERQTQFIATNKISRDVNDLNNSVDKEALFSALPHLQQVTDSIYLNNILFNDKGERKTFQLDMGYIQGTIDKRDKPIPGERLTEPQRLVQEINQNLSGRYYILVPADSKTQWMLQMKNLVPFKDVAANSNNYLNRTLDNFLNYYNTEKASYQLRKDAEEPGLEKKLTIFKELSNNYTATDDEFKANLLNFLQLQANQQLSALQGSLTITSNKGDKSFTWNSIDGEFLKREQLNHKKLSQEDINNILFFRTINFALNNVEQQKLFFGDILEYKDVKRYKLFLSPREISMSGIPEYNSFLNEQMNNVDGIPLDSNILGKYTFQDTFPTVTLKDVTAINEHLSEISPAYKDINTTDAQAYSTLTAMRSRRLKAGNWSEKDNIEYQYRMAVDRQLMLEDSVLSNATYPKELQEHDSQLVKKGNPNSSYIYVEKPILSGHTETDGTYHPIVDKFSIVSFSYSAIRNTNFRDHYVKMMKQGIGYSIVSSGRKVGARSSDTFYNSDGTINKEPYTSLITVPFSAFGTQTDNSSKKENQTRGSQLTKLSIINLHDNGKPITEEAGKLAQHNISLLRELTQIGYQKLLQEIGAEDVDGEYRIKDKSKVLTLVKNELLRREVSDNIKQALSINPLTDDLSTAFEALPNYQQIKNILYSHVDKYITTPKMNGGPKVQVSGALMEKHGFKRTIVNGKLVTTSEGLKFYTKDEPYMEVLLPFWAAKKLRQAGLKWNTEEELYTLLSSSPDSKSLLSAIGFRIPTQELNSMENMRIKGFLPEEMGDTIVVPEEITTKAGSDFDIDKLNSYLKNIYIDNKKQVRSIPYFGIGEEAKEKLKNWLSQDVAEDFLLNISKADPDALDNVDFDASEEAATSAFNKFYHQSIENEYFTNLSDILSLPENFERLVTPNTADDLKSIRDQLVELAPEFDVQGIKSIISPSFMLRTRHEGQSIKSLVGIAAVAQTRTAVSQLSSITIDPTRIYTLDNSEKKFLGDSKTFNIQLPHNTIDNQATMSSIKDREGRYISDKNSQYINGTVDAFNDAFLAQINFSRKTAPVYLFLEDVGVPNSAKYPIVSFFMNQPIIRQYLKALDIQGKNYLADNNTAMKIKKLFPANRPSISLPQDFTALKDVLSSSISKYYNGVDLTREENAQQHLILNEFLKYDALAKNLFRFQQGTNYDTATINDSHSLFFKEDQYRLAQVKSVFTDAPTYISSTFIGSQRDALISSTMALTDVLKIENPITKYALSPILHKIAQKYISLQDKNDIARKLEESLINHLIQTKTGINSSIQHMMVDAQTALVNQIKQFKKQTTNDDIIWGNVILKQLIPSIKGSTALSTKNITLAVRPNDVFSKNLYTDSFQQLYDHPATSQMARSLIKLSFLQNGVAQSPISYKDYIPASLYARVVNEAINYFQDELSLQSFIDSGSFYRNNWMNDDIVPVVTSDDYEIGGYKPVLDYINALKSKSHLPADARTPTSLWVDEWNSNSKEPFLTHIDFGEGDETPIKRFFRRVEDVDGTPITIQIENEDGSKTKKTLFTQSNAWGDSFRAQEYYNSNQPSVLSNGYIKTPHELNPQSLAAFIRSGVLDGNISQEVEAPIQKVENIAQKTEDVSPDEASVPQITQVTRAGKKEKYALTLQDGTKEEREGYKLTIKEYPQFRGYITSVSKGVWKVDELTTSKSIPVEGDTIKEILAELSATLNKAFESPQNRDILNRIGLFTQDDINKCLG